MNYARHFSNESLGFGARVEPGPAGFATRKRCAGLTLLHARQRPVETQLRCARVEPGHWHGEIHNNVAGLTSTRAIDGLKTSIAMRASGPAKNSLESMVIVLGPLFNTRAKKAMKLTGPLRASSPAVNGVKPHTGMPGSLFALLVERYNTLIERQQP